MKYPFVLAAFADEAGASIPEQISAMAGNRDWQYWTIIDVGICNDNIWMIF